MGTVWFHLCNVWNMVKCLLTVHPKLIIKGQDMAHYDDLTKHDSNPNTLWSEPLQLSWSHWTACLNVPKLCVPTTDTSPMQTLFHKCVSIDTFVIYCSLRWLMRLFVKKKVLFIASQKFPFLRHLVFFSLRQSYCVSMAVQEHTMQSRLDSNSQTSA